MLLEALRQLFHERRQHVYERIADKAVRKERQRLMRAGVKISMDGTLHQSAATPGHQPRSQRQPRRR